MFSLLRVVISSFVSFIILFLQASILFRLRASVTSKDSFHRTLRMYFMFALFRVVRFSGDSCFLIIRIRSLLTSFWRAFFAGDSSARAFLCACLTFALQRSFFCYDSLARSTRFRIASMALFNFAFLSNVVSTES